LSSLSLDAPLIFGDCQLMVHLFLLFNAMLQHSFVPSDFCKGIIIPLLKDKHGDATPPVSICTTALHWHLHCQTFLNHFHYASTRISLLTISCNLVLRRRLAACMHCLYSITLSNILQKENLRYIVAYWMVVKHLTKFCILIIIIIKNVKIRVTLS